jgi:hypothetical protein
MLARGAVSVACCAIGCDGGAVAINPAPVTTRGGDAAAPLAEAGAFDASYPDVWIAPKPDAAADTAAPDSGLDAGPVLRTVESRPTFGDLDPTNLLHDGDFELSGLDTMQYPWLGLEQKQIRIGPACRSGLRCVSLRPGEYAAGTFVWPSSKKVTVSFFGHPTGQDCAVEGTGLVLALDAEPNDPSLQPVRIAAATPAPVDGWCRYEQTIDVPPDPGYHFWALLVAARSKATDSSVFDQASIRIAQGTGSASSAVAAPIADDVRQLLVEARRELRKRLPPNPPRKPVPIANPTGRRRNMLQ